MNFNWLMGAFGATIAWNYLMIQWGELSDQFKAEADAIWPEGESNRVVNHYSNQGNYAPAEYNDPGRKICSVKLGVYSYDMGKQKIVLPF